MDVFLSHSETDRAAAETLADDLTKAGHRLLFDWRLLFPGENWAQRLGEALEQSHAMVVLLSPAALKSSGVQREIEFALGSLNYANRVIPILVKPTKMDTIPWILRQFAVVDGTADLGLASRKLRKRLQTVERAAAHG